MKRSILAVLALAVTPASAPAAPLVIGTFYQETVSADCSSGSQSVCVVSFTPAPPKVPVIVTDASCVVTMQPGNTLLSLMMRSVTADGQIIARHTALPPGFQASNPSLRKYLVQAKINHGFPSGQRPTIVAETVGTSNVYVLNCTIAGTLVK